MEIEEEFDGQPLFPVVALSDFVPFDRKISTNVCVASKNAPELGFRMRHLLDAGRNIFKINEGTEIEGEATGLMSTYFISAKTTYEIDRQFYNKRKPAIEPHYREFWGNIFREALRNPRVFIKSITFTSPRVIKDDAFQQVDVDRIKYKCEYDEHICNFTDSPQKLFLPIILEDGKVSRQYLRIHLGKTALFFVMKAMYGSSGAKRIYKKKRKLNPEGLNCLDIQYRTISRMEIGFARI